MQQGWCRSAWLKLQVKMILQRVNSGQVMGEEGGWSQTEQLGASLQG